MPTPDNLMFVSDEDVRRHVPFTAVLDAVERAFIALDAGHSQLFDVARGKGGGPDHFFAVKSARDGSIPMLGLKAGSYAPANHARGLPAHTSTTLLIDDETGRAVAVVEANYLNGLRTSAANALAVRALARADAETLGIIGIGAQAIFEALAVSHVRPIRRILAVGASAQRRNEFAAAIAEQSDATVEFTSAEVAARRADVLVTVTPARAPVVRTSWIRPGTHVSAMGADDIGKQELETDLLAHAKLWVDHPGQASRIGEAQHAYRAGLLTIEQLQGRTLGRLLREQRNDVRTADDITVFDSSGLGIQDIAAAYAALQCVQAHRSAAAPARPQ